MRRPLPSVCLPLLLLGLAGCRSVQTGLHENETLLATRYGAEARVIADRRVRILDWPSALTQMQAHNLALQEARDAVTTAEERLRQVDRDLLPGAALTGSLSTALTALGDFRGEDAALAVYGFFNLPGLIQWRLRHYATELQLLRTRMARELKARELAVQLRELFVRSHLLIERRRQFALAQRWRPPPALALSLDTSPPQLEQEALQRSFRLEEENLQTALAGLLGDATVRWQPAADYLPRFDYDVAPFDPHDPARFGRLYRRLQAAELEGARLRQRGVTLQAWPDLQVNLSSPPLYQSRGGRSWSFDSLQLTLGATVPLDLRGAIAQQLRETQRDFARLEARLREQNARTITALNQARAALQLNARQLRLAELRLEALRSLPPGLSPARARDNLERLLVIDQQRTALLLEKTQLEGLFWILDETRWPADPAP